MNRMPRSYNVDACGQKPAAMFCPTNLSTNVGWKYREFFAYFTLPD